MWPGILFISDTSQEILSCYAAYPALDLEINWLGILSCTLSCTSELFSAIAYFWPPIGTDYESTSSKLLFQ